MSKIILIGLIAVIALTIAIGTKAIMDLNDGRVLVVVKQLVNK